MTKCEKMITVKTSVKTPTKRKKLKLIRSNRPECKIITDKYYENDHRTKLMSFGAYTKLGYGDHSVQIINAYVVTGIVTMKRKIAVTNEKNNIVTQIIQLITKSFDGIPHIQKYRKRNLMERICYDTDTLLKPNNVF